MTVNPRVDHATEAYFDAMHLPSHQALRSHTGRTWPVLDSAALHGLAGDIVEIIEPETEADPVAVLTQVLVMFGNACGPRPHALVGAAGHPARLNALLVGDTARARKGQSFREARRLFEVAEPTWAANRIVGGLSSGEGLIAQVADPVEDEDGKPEGGVDDKRLLVVEEEFARTLSASERTGSTLSSVVRQAFDDGRLRVMTRKPLTATGTHISVIGHVTRDELERKLTETDIGNGLANRFMFVATKRSKLLPSGGNVDPTDIDDLSTSLALRIENAKGRLLLQRTPDAEARWAEIYVEMAESDCSGIVGSLTARADAITLRLSLIYALLDGKPAVDVSHVEAGYALWRYCEASVRYIFGNRTGNPVADKLLPAIRQAGAKGLNRTQQHAIFSRHIDEKALDRAAVLLELHGLALVVKRPTGGRPQEVLVATEHATASEAKEAQEGTSR